MRAVRCYNGGSVAGADPERIRRLLWTGQLVCPYKLSVLGPGSRLFRAAVSRVRADAISRTPTSPAAQLHITQEYRHQVKSGGRLYLLDEQMIGPHALLRSVMGEFLPNLQTPF